MTEDELYARIAGILDAARGRVARTVNTAMVHAYWRIDRAIVLVEQGGAARAGYGDQLMEVLARRLTAQYGRGFGVATLRRIRSLYLAFPDGSAIPQIRSTPLTGSAGDIRSTALIETDDVRFPPTLGWSHYLVLLRVQRPEARRFYEIEAAREGWSVRELERQVASLAFERLAANKTADQARTIGIVLCSDKNDAMIRITLPEGNEQIVAARYQTYLPTEAELRAELTRESEEAERVLRLASDPEPSP